MNARRMDIFRALKEDLNLDIEFYFNRPVLGKILILNKMNAEKFTYEKPWACISITYAKANDKADLTFAEINTENRVDLLQLRFDDVTFVPDEVTDKWSMFSEEQAQQIWDFVSSVWDRVDLLMIHCHAGLSRSTACGMVLSEKYHPECAGWYERLYMPNPHVAELLRAKLYGSVAERYSELGKIDQNEV